MNVANAMIVAASVEGDRFVVSGEYSQQGADTFREVFGKAIAAEVAQKLREKK